MEKIADIIESIAHEKGLELGLVRERIHTALIITAKKIYGQEYEFFVDEGLRLYQKILIVADDDERLAENPASFISLAKAKAEAGQDEVGEGEAGGEDAGAGLEIGDELTYECSLENLGRTAVSILHRELDFHMQRLLEQTIFEKYKSQVGNVVYGSVVRVDSDETTYIEIDELRAFLPRKNRIKGESFKVGEVLKAVLRKVYIDGGIKLELSRTSPKFLERLLESEVPEIKDGNVEVMACSRIPGLRAKILVQSKSSNIDPVGATVGVKGVRINAVGKELNGESIDCLEYSEDPAVMISRALSPAIISSVKILSNDEHSKRALVSLASEQKSRAIGKGGLNIRLASMLSGFELELRELGGGLGGLLGGVGEGVCEGANLASETSSDAAANSSAAAGKTSEDAAAELAGQGEAAGDTVAATGSAEGSVTGDETVAASATPATAAPAEVSPAATPSKTPTLGDLFAN